MACNDYQKYHKRRNFPRYQADVLPPLTDRNKFLTERFLAQNMAVKGVQKSSTEQPSNSKHILKRPVRFPSNHLMCQIVPTHTFIEKKENRFTQQHNAIQEPRSKLPLNRKRHCFPTSYTSPCSSSPLPIRRNATIFDQCIEETIIVPLNATHKDSRTCHLNTPEKKNTRVKDTRVRNDESKARTRRFGVTASTDTTRRAREFTRVLRKKF